MVRYLKRLIGQYFDHCARLRIVDDSDDKQQILRMSSVRPESLPQRSDRSCRVYYSQERTACIKTNLQQ